MATQEKALEGSIRVARVMLEELAEAGFVDGDSQEDIHKRLMESIQQLDYSDRARIVRAMTGEEIEALRLDYRLFEIYVKASGELGEAGYQQYNQADDALLLGAIKSVSDILVYVLTHAASAEVSGEPKLYFGIEDGDLVWVDDPAFPVKQNAKHLGVPLPEGEPGEASGDLASLLRNVLDGEAGAVVIARRDAVDPQEGPEQSAARSQKPRFEKSEDGKVVYMTPPTETKQ